MCGIFTSGRNSSSLKRPPSKGESSGPVTITWKYRAFASSGTALMPGTGSWISLCVSLIMRRGKAAILCSRTLFSVSGAARKSHWATHKQRETYGTRVGLAEIGDKAVFSQCWAFG